MPIRTVFILSVMALGSGTAAAQQPPGPQETSPLADTRWFLVDFQSMDDARGRSENPRPLAYTMALGADGRATLKLDCNRARGPWAAQPAGDGATGNFALGPLGVTRALCPDDTLGPKLTRDAQAIRGYRLEDDRLHLSLMADGGIYTWAPLQYPSFDCERADSAATELICTDATLAALDRELTRLYARALKTPAMPQPARKTLIATQRGWIKGRDDCWKADDLRQCVLASMLMRIHELRTLGVPERTGADDISTGPFVLDCNDAQINASVTFVTALQPHAYLQWNTEGIAMTAAMTATPVASGSRYAGRFLDTPVSLWIKGHEAVVEHGNTPARTCRLKSQEH